MKLFKCLLADSYLLYSNVKSLSEILLFSKLCSHISNFFTSNYVTNSRIIINPNVFGRVEAVDWNEERKTNKESPLLVLFRALVKHLMTDIGDSPTVLSVNFVVILFIFGKKKQRFISFEEFKVWRLDLMYKLTYFDS